MTDSSNRSMPPSAEIAGFASALTVDEIPETALVTCERSFLDTAGVILAGKSEGAGPITAAVRSANTGGGPARIFGDGRWIPADDAAFVNATAGHVHDFDDYNQALINHPSVVLVPAILAMGEAANATGLDALRAYVVGFEAQCYLGIPIIQSHYKAGWFSTTTLGTIGVAAAIASLLEFDKEQTRTAIDIAAGFAGGFRRHNGTKTKPLLVGNAARAGITAARHAAAGIDAAPAFTGPGGFYELHNGDPNPSHRRLPSAGGPWAIEAEGVHLKKYPCCSDTHTSIAATERLVTDQDISPSNVESVSVRTSNRALDVLEYDDPLTGTEAMFSMHYVIASMIARNRVAIPDFSEENITVPEVQSLLDLIDHDVDPTLTYADLKSTVQITTDAGRFEQVVEKPPGHHENPLSRGELHEKFIECATYSLAASQAEDAFEVLEAIRRVDDVTEIVDLLVPEAGS